MSDLWKKIIAEAKKVSLKEEEKFLMLQNIKKHIEEEKFEPVITTTHIQTPYFSRFQFSFTLHEKRFVPIAVVLILTIFGGTAFAAHNSLPGDVLYSMKVNVNEKVESWAALSPNATARFEAVKAERRLMELEKITVQKKNISKEAKAQVKDNLDKNIQKVKELTAEIAASGDVDKAASVKAELESTLEAHSVVLGKLSTDNEVDKITEVSEEDKADIKEINNLVDAHINDLKTDSEDSDTENNEEENSDVKEDSEVEKTSSTTENNTDIDESGTTLFDIGSSELSVSSQTLSEEESEESENDEVKSETKEKKEGSRESKKEATRKADDSKLKAEVESILKDLDLSIED